MVREKDPGQMSRRRVLRALAQLSIGGALLAASGCGGARSAPPTATSLATTPAAVATKPPGANGKVSLSWLISDFSVGTQKWFHDTFIPAFQKNHPSTEVTVLYIPWGSLAQKRDTMFAGGSAPDLLQSGAAMVVDYALKHLVRPADDWLRQWSDRSDYYPTTFETATFEGKTYGIPARVQGMGMLYRRDLFEAKQLDLPKTWDDLKHAALALTERQGSNFTRLGYSIQFNNQQFFAVLWQNGGEVLTADGRKPVFNSDAGVETLTYWVDLLDSIAPPGTQLASTGPQIPLIAAGRIAAEYTGNGEMFNIVQFAPDMVQKIKVNPPLIRKAQVINVFNNWYGVTTQSKSPELAWELLTFFNQPDYLLAFNETVSSIPPRKSLASTPYMTDPKYQMSAFLENVERYSRPQPRVANYAECWKALDDALDAALRKQQTPKQALDGAAQKWQQLLDEAFGGQS